ncbi:hypothetical protein KJZ63_03940 [Patescibacteria group bacterium]|nr:hypothetical protein [Patescibacteria group bacterium]
MITKILTNERVLLTLLVIAAVFAAAVIAISVVGIRNPADAYATYVYEVGEVVPEFAMNATSQEWRAKHGCEIGTPCQKISGEE